MKYLFIILFIIFSKESVCQNSFGYIFLESKPDFVAMVYKGSPADKAGLKAGDQIYNINKIPFKKESANDAAEYLKSFDQNAEFLVLREEDFVKITISREPTSNFMNKCVEGDCENGIGTANTPDFSYTGKFTAKKIHGTGKLYARTGAVYEGEFIDNTFQGNGKLTEYNGDIYVGSFDQGSKSGRGKMTKKSGEIYEGEFNNNLPNGKGQLIEASSIYKGAFLNGKKNGRGTMWFLNGDVFEGDFIDNQYQGDGIFYDIEKDITTGGVWQNNVLVEAKQELDNSFSLKIGKSYPILRLTQDLFNNFILYKGDKLSEKENGIENFDSKLWMDDAITILATSNKESAAITVGYTFPEHTKVYEFLPKNLSAYELIRDVMCPVETTKVEVKKDNRTMVTFNCDKHQLAIYMYNNQQYFFNFFK